jgi:lecithin-cholesterol acyltransferase
MFGSVLYGDINKIDTHWYCGKNKKNEFLWIKDKYLVPQVVNCLADYMKCEWNSTSHKPKSREGANIYTIDFGGLSAVRYIDHGILGKHFIPDLIHMITKLENEGYIEKVDLFGAPYDWRMNPISLDDYYLQLKQLIEDIYTQTGNQKVTMYGISAGCMAIHNFLTTQVTQEWKDKYMKKIILHGPSFGGAGDALRVIWDNKVSFLPKVYNTESFRKMIVTIPTLHGHMPNAHTNEKLVYVIGPDGKEYYAKDLPQLMIDQGKIKDEAKELFESSFPYIERDILPPGVPTYILFNSVLETPLGYNFKDGWDKPGVPLTTLGDNTITKDSLYYACDKWKTSVSTVCHDIKINDTKYSHSGQLVCDDIQDILYNAIKDDSWVVKGVHNITGNTIKMWKSLRPK